MALLDSKFVQILLILLAVYMVSQIFMKDGFQENLDTIVTVTDPTGNPPVVNIEQPPASAAAVTVNRPAPEEAVIQVSDTSQGFPSGTPAAAEANTLSSSELAGAILNPAAASATPVVTSAPSAALPAPSKPSALTAVEETLLAAAPEGSQATPVGGQLFAPEPDVDYDSIFSHRGALEPADLLPKTPAGGDVELYGGIQPDPKLAQDFLTNTWSQGITIEKSRNVVNDLRGYYPIAQTLPLVFNQTTVLPDIPRKSIAELV